MNKLEKLFEEIGTDILFSSNVVDEIVTSENRWNEEVYTVVKVDDEYYGVSWIRGVGGSEDQLPESASEFERVYRKDEVVVKAKRKWATDLEEDGVDRFRNFRVYNNHRKAKRMLAEVGTDEAVKAIKQAEEALRTLYPLAKRAGEVEHAIAADEYLEIMEEFVTMIRDERW